MYNLRRFIIKNHFVILFILLEVISLLLLARSQNFQKQRVISTTNDAVGKIYEWSSEVGNYFHLGRTNEQLAEENAWLRQQLSIVIDTATVKYDISKRDTLYEFIPAQVVNSSINQRNNYIVINKGQADGIRPDMTVISSEGLVGVVADVSRHYASVISLLHSNSIIGVRFKDNQEIGSLVWGTNNYRYGTVKDIATHISLQPGDTVLTNSWSYIIPEDLMVGIVEELHVSSKGDLNSAKISFATDFATLRHVYVINNLHKAELDSLRANFKQP